MDHSNNHRILRLKDVCAQTGLCRSAIYDLEAQSRFPTRIQLTSRAVGWLEAEVRDWIEDRILTSRQKCRTRISTEGEFCRGTRLVRDNR